MMRANKKDTIRNIVLSVIFLVSSYVLFANFLLNLIQFEGGYQDGKNLIFNLLFFIMQFILVFIFVMRDSPEKRYQSYGAAVAAILGTFLPSFFSFGEFKNFFLLDLFVYFGAILTLISILYLGKSFGITVAKRKLVVKGPYKYIRHPMYAGYIITNVALFILSPFNIVRAFLLIFWLVSTIMRTKYEDSFLLKFSEYKKYTYKVKYKLIPQLW